MLALVSVPDTSGVRHEKWCTHTLRGGLRTRRVESDATYKLEIPDKPHFVQARRQRREGRA